MTMHAHFPPFVDKRSKPVKAHRVVMDPELGGLRHILIQIEDEAQARHAIVCAMTSAAQDRGEYTDAGVIGN